MHRILAVFALVLALVSCGLQAQDAKQVASSSQALSSCPLGQTFVTLQDVGDASVRSDQPNTPKGSGTAVSAVVSTATHNLLVTFDASTIPSNATIQAAELGVSALINSSTGGAVHQATSAWAESTVTWNTRPSIGPSIASVPSGTGIQAITIPASVVQDWVAGANNGLLVDVVSGQYTIASREYAGGGHPIVKVCYSVPSPSDGGGGTTTTSTSSSTSSTSTTGTGYSATGPVVDSNGFDVWTVTASSMLQSPSPVSVVKPASCTSTSRCRVLFILGPLSANDTAGLAEARRLGLGDTYGLILVTPGVSYSLPNTYGYYGEDSDLYANHMLDTYLATAVVDLIDTMYPTTASASDRFLIGYSKTGHWAFTELLHHPTVFARAASFDGTLGVYATPGGAVVSSTVWASSYRMPDLFNGPAGMPFVGGAWRFAIWGYDYFQSDNAAIASAMTTRGIPYHINNSTYYTHSWTSGWLGPAVADLVGP